MELRIEKICACCDRTFCKFANKQRNLQECIYNLIIYEDEKKILLYNLPSKSIYKIFNGGGIEEISFQQAIREIDIIPTKAPAWKRIQILNLAKDLGFFGA